MTKDVKKYVIESHHDSLVSCEVVGYPLPKVSWYFNPLDIENTEILKVNTNKVLYCFLFIIYI